MERKQFRTAGILAEDICISQDTWRTQINNNVLVVGPSGAGKTRSYVKPNILQANTNMIVSDAKGTLYGETAPVLRANGYEVYKLDFANMNGNVGYNPLRYIRYDAERREYDPKDILRVSEIAIQSLSQKEPFWDVSARMYLSSVIAYVLEALPDDEHTFEYVNKVITEFSAKNYDRLMNELEIVNPNSFAVKKYREFIVMSDAEKMSASIRGITTTNLSSFDFREAVDMYNRQPQVDFAAFGDRKIALFLTVSDTDRSQDKLANMFWTQALQGLVGIADHSVGGRLKRPVRLYLDDFATNVYIPDFDKITSNIRSREIYVSVILQSVAQLESLYGEARASTIIGNCDQQLVLGVQDLKIVPAKGEEKAARKEKPRLVENDEEEATPDRALMNANQVQNTGDEIIYPLDKDKKNEKKDYSVFVYMVGSDLEASYGYATRDMREMTDSGIDFSKTNLVIYTGGSRLWKSDIPSDQNNVLDMSLEGEDRVVAATGNTSDMGAPETLAAFLAGVPLTNR